MLASARECCKCRAEVCGEILFAFIDQHHILSSSLATPFPSSLTFSISTFSLPKFPLSSDNMAISKLEQLFEGATLRTQELFAGDTDSSTQGRALKRLKGTVRKKRFSTRVSLGGGE